jgi:asparagine synthase (glutamine-hydrolysing)
LHQRPKMGFHLPLSTWLRGPLREWAEDLLDPGCIRQEGLLDPEPIRLKWHEHLSGRRDRVDHLWPVLMFRSWLKHQGPARLGSPSKTRTSLSTSSSSGVHLA